MSRDNNLMDPRHPRSPYNTCNVDSPHYNADDARIYATVQVILFGPLVLYGIFVFVMGILYKVFVEQLPEAVTALFILFFGAFVVLGVIRAGVNNGSIKTVRDLLLVLFWSGVVGCFVMACLAGSLGLAPWTFDGLVFHLKAS